MSVLVGRVGLVIKGAWNSSVAYASMDVVTYNNSTYIAKQASPAGTLPTNTTYWQPALDASALTDKALIATVETTNIATSAHAIGSYFINASGMFVKTISAIAIGDTISGSNTEITTIAEILESDNVVNTLTPGDMHPVTSNAVYNALALKHKIIKTTLENVQTTSSGAYIYSSTYHDNILSARLKGTAGFCFLRGDEDIIQCYDTSLNPLSNTTVSIELYRYET